MYSSRFISLFLCLPPITPPDLCRRDEVRVRFDYLGIRCNNLQRRKERKKESREEEEEEEEETEQQQQKAGA